MADTTFISKVTAIAASWLQDINDTVYKVFAAAKTATDARAALQVPSNARAINTTAPLTGGGDLGADRTLGVSDATGAAKGVIQLAGDLSGTAGAPTVPGLTSKVPTTRAVNTTAPLTGGGALSADLTLGVSAASDTAQGVVELATNAETITGTDAVRAVTPAGLAAKVASETAQGIVELATAAETTTGTDTTRAVHPAGLKVELDKKESVLHVNTTAVGNVGTGTDDLMSYSLPANTLSVDGKALRITAWGTTANNANAKSLTILFGSGGQIFAMTTSINGQWKITMFVLRTGSNAQDRTIEIVETPGGSTLAASKLSVSTGTLTETDSSAITIKLTGAATSNNDIVQEGMLVELLN